MNGDELGCSDLHLAVQDTLLVGQVIEDFHSSETTKMHRLQVRNIPFSLYLCLLEKYK